MHIESLVSSNTGLVVVADSSVNRAAAGATFDGALTTLSAMFGTPQVVVFHAGGRGDFKVRVELSDAPGFAPPDQACSRCEGLLALPTGELVIDDGTRHASGLASGAMRVAPGEYAAAAYILDAPEGEAPANNVFDRFGPWLIPSTIVTFIAGAAASSWYESSLLFYATLGAIAAGWAAYLLAFNLTGGPERERRTLELGPVDFLVQLRPNPTTGGSAAKGCELTV